MSKEETERLARMYAHSADSVNYISMSKEMGLHSNALELIRPTTAPTQD